MSPRCHFADVPGTHLRLVHDGFTAADAFGLETMGNGWRTHVGRRLEQVLATVA